MHLSVGVDEAGRGCVLGPLVVACVAATATDRRWFAAHNVRDSKIVPPRERETLAARIKERCWFALAIVGALEIDRAVADRTRTLNGLELEQMADLLRTFRGAHPERSARACIDAPSVNARRFTQELHAASGWNDATTLRAIHKADVTNRTVAAASIVAKDERERLLALIKKELDLDFGCGYPHDPATRAFVSTCSRQSPHVRWSWRTAQLLTPTPS